jgi:hypothetical protein
VSQRRPIRKVTEAHTRASDLESENAMQCIALTAVATVGGGARAEDMSFSRDQPGLMRARSDGRVIHPTRRCTCIISTEQEGDIGQQRLTSIALCSSLRWKAGVLPTCRYGGMHVNKSPLGWGNKVSF